MAQYQLQLANSQAALAETQPEGESHKHESSRKGEVETEGGDSPLGASLLPPPPPPPLEDADVERLREMVRQLDKMNDYSCSESTDYCPLP